MKIINFELNPNEDVSIHQTGHGGGTCFSRYAKEILNTDSDEFWILGQASNFKNIKKDERCDRILVVDPQTIESLKRGFPVTGMGTFFDDADIIIHNYGEVSLNLSGLKAKQVCWYSFVGQSHHPNTPNCFVYSRDQNVICGPEIKVFDVKIGKPVKKNFNPTPKEDFLFQCTRNDSTMDSAETARLCKKFRIKAYFGGPIFDNYPLMSQIDNINTFYLGELTEEDKLSWSSRARLYGCIQNWDTIFSLSAVEALGQGTPIVARLRGCFTYLINHGVNGFFYDGWDASFRDIWHLSKNIDQKKCYNKAKEYSETEMVNSFYKNFELILKNG